MVKRYARAPILGGGSQYGSSFAINAIKKAVDAGQLSVRVQVMQGEERLDVIAGRLYEGQSQNWWIIAAASGIGWALQVPPGTRLVIPTDLSQVADIVG